MSRLQCICLSTDLNLKPDLHICTNGKNLKCPAHPKVNMKLSDYISLPGNGTAGTHTGLAYEFVGDLVPTAGTCMICSVRTHPRCPKCRAHCVDRTCRVHWDSLPDITHATFKRDVKPVDVPLTNFRRKRFAIAAMDSGCGPHQTGRVIQLLDSDQRSLFNMLPDLLES